MKKHFCIYLIPCAEYYARLMRDGKDKFWNRKQKETKFFSEKSEICDFNSFAECSQIKN